MFPSISFCAKNQTRFIAGFFVYKDNYQMSWWEEHGQHISESPFVVGFVVAVVTSLLSTYKRSPKMRFVARITEAATCAMLSLGLTKLGIHYLDFSPDMSLPVAVFVSWIGTDSLTTALNKIFEKWLGKQEPKV